LEGLRKVREATGNFPLVAIGGINLENLREVYEAGADSAAIISSLLSEAEIISQNYKLFSSV